MSPMIDAESVLIFTSVLIASYVICNRRSLKPVDGSTSRRLPPTVPSLPVIGSLLSLPRMEKLPEWFLERKSVYGDVVGFYSGPRFSVILQSREAINEALLKKSADFASRPSGYSVELFNPGQYGIINRPYGDGFRKYHQLVLSILKEFGFGQAGVMETRIANEVEQLVAEFAALAGRPVDPLSPLTRSVANVISGVLFGQPFARSDQGTLDALVADVRDFIAGARVAIAVNVFRPIRFLPSVRRRLQIATDAHDRFLATLRTKIADSLRAADADPRAVSLVSRFVELEGADGVDGNELLFVVRDLVMAGTETSTTTLRWALAIAADRPDAVQRRLQADIDAVVDASRLPSLDDRAKLPRVEAFVLEVMRYQTLAPTIPRLTMRDTQVAGYFIPAKTMVFPSMYAVHNDPDVWNEPRTFNADRFLDSEGHVINSERVIPFSLGKRSCLGEILARQEIFLFLTGILQHFYVLPPEGQDTVGCQPVGIPVAPSEFSIRLIPRKSR